MSEWPSSILILIVIPCLALARSADNDDANRALFRFLFPDARIEIRPHGATIHDRSGHVRADRMHNGWRIYLPERRVWEARRFGEDGWRVINHEGRVIELRPVGHSVLAGTDFDGRWREVRRIGTDLQVDSGNAAYWDHLHRQQRERENEVKGLPTRSRLLRWRRE